MYDPTEQHLAGLAPGLAGAAVDLISAARQAGIPLVVISGRRAQDRNALAGGAPRSLHLAGLAFDVAVLGHPRDSIPFCWWQALGEYAETLGLYWGGRFLSRGRPDVNHFDARRFLA